MEFAVCEGCWKRTLDPRLSLEGDKTLCPNCASAEKERWQKHYADQEALEALHRQVESEE